MLKYSVHVHNLKTVEAPLLTLIHSSLSYKVSPSDLTDLHVIRYELERDLMPLVLANTQYSIEKGKETLHEFDLPKIQQQIMARFFLGKPLITLNVRISF